MLYDAQETIQNLNPTPVAAAAESSTTNVTQNITNETVAGGTQVTTTTGSNPNVTQLLGILAQAQRSYIPEYTSLPILQDPASQNGSLISVNGILYRFNGDQQPGEWQIQAAVAAYIEDTYANWTLANYPPSAYPIGTQFLITTWNVVYSIRIVSGSNAWVYTQGSYVAPAASRPTTGFNGAALGTNDAGLLFIASDTQILEYWTGAAWAQVPKVPASATVLASNSSDQIIAAPLPSADIWVGNVSNLPVAVALSGDATLSNTGALTLANTAVTPAIYGDATHVAVINVNSKGLLIGVANQAIAFPGPTSAQIIAALGYIPAAAGNNSTFSLTASLITGAVTGTITQT